MNDPLFHVLAQLVRKGLLDVDDIDEIAARLTDEGQDDEAHDVRAAFAEAHVEKPAPHRPHLVPVEKLQFRYLADGGNDAA